MGEDMKRDDGGPAFPHLSIGYDGASNITGGMSLRDCFAAQALNGMISSCPTTNRTAANKHVRAGVAYDFADAMLEARKAEVTNGQRGLCTHTEGIKDNA